MSGISLNVDVQEGSTPKLRQFLAGLTDLRGLHESIGLRARTLTRDHLIGIAGSRHATANKLGASPSGHWAQAAEKTSFEADANSATVTISHPGIGRAMHDVDILPKGKCLTIPLIAFAYNVRAAAVWESEGLFVLKSKSGNAKAVAGKRLAGGTFQPWYLLVPKVHQAQDRSLLPSDDEYRIAGKEGARDYVNYLLIRQN